MKSERWKKNRLKRLTSFMLTLAMVFNIIFGNGIPLSVRNHAVLTVHAEEEEEEALPDYTPSNTSFSKGSVNLQTITEIVDYCYLYKSSETFASDHQNDAVIMSLTNEPSNRNLGSNFVGLGSKNYPFNGSVTFAGANTQDFSLPRAFFGYVYDNVVLYGNGGNTSVVLQLTRNGSVGDDSSSPLFADCVKKGTGNAYTWNVEAVDSADTYSGLIGNIEADAAVSVSFTNSSSAAMVSNATGTNKDIGALCGKMGAGSSLTVTSYSGTANVSITSANGNAGGFVGTMEGNAILSVTSAPTSYAPSVTATTGNAGGIAGDITSDATITLPASIAVGGIIVGGNGSGGLFGHYLNKETTKTFDISSYYNGITATATGLYAGGLFGIFENAESDTSYSVTFTGSNSTDTHTSGSVNTYDNTGYYGGLIGCYIADKLADSLIFSSLTMKSGAARSFASYGGIIGIVDSAAYISADTVSVTASGMARRTAADFFGGIVGTTSSTNGVFIDLGSFTLSAAGYYGGGVVGEFNSGVLRISGTTNMSSAKPGGNSSSSVRNGQLVGINNNVLVYTPGNWTYNRSSGAIADDLGVWGEVVRVADIETNILTLDDTAHTVTVAAAVPAMATQTDFVKTALNIQLNDGTGYDCLLFTSGSKTALLATDLSISADISLAGTGINGLMRDGYVADVTDGLGCYTGTFNGNDHNITLTIGEKHGNGITSASTAEGVGQIYRHQYNGLFSVLAGTVQNLVIKNDSFFNIRNCADGMNIGGIAAKNGGAVTLTKVVANETVNYYEGSNITGNEGKNIGGLIGLVDTDGTITINGVSSVGAKFVFAGHHESSNAYGGAIGKVTASSFTLNVGATGNAFTLALDTDITGITDVDSDSEGGGLVGMITNAGSYGSRTVNINNLVYNGTIIGNVANTNGGGLLGYSWLNTTTNISGLTVTNATINNCTTGGTSGGNTNLGLMCYEATGKWTVNSLAVNGLTVSGGGSASLGMLVNKMYTTSSGNVTGALYLDVLNSGYTLTGAGITLPDTIGVYDEIAVYSAPDVVAGGAGVISINMNSARNTGSALITTTGTYQNKLATSSSDALTASKYPNANARYYYNLDKMSTSDAGQKLVLWSVEKYIYSGISSAVPTSGVTGNTLTGTANLAGLSYYPIKNAGDYTLNGLKVTFDYNGAYGAENTIVSPVVTDSYVRDPGAMGANKNQHYLMHGGLFINLSKGKTITVSDESSIGGTFLEVDGYKGALISGTMNGNLNVSGSIELVGLIPKTTGNAAYNGGYLLINEISRPDSQTETITVNINGLSTSGYSGVTLPVAKSLIGSADGRGFTFDFTSIKLDSRKAAISDSTVNSALTTEYGTSTSLFSDATLFYSINTDQNSEMTYNFTYADDWGAGNRNVTYGYEISGTIENKDPETNKSRQLKYSGAKKNYTNPSGENTEYTFSSDVFLPYVKTPYDASADHSGKYQRELKVNYLIEISSSGCGTYNDPYVIESADQLVAIAAFLKNGNSSTNINLSSIILPKYDAEKFNGVELNTTGARWCTDKSGTGYHVEYEYNTSGDNFTATGCNSWTEANVQYYLASAYYKINKNITLGSDFVGLGGTTANTAFRGVIVGDTNADGTPKYTITNKTSNPFINVSNGCAIKDVALAVNCNTGISLAQANNGTANAYFDYDYTNTTKVCRFYGGFVGELMGGDTIIDNSYVTYTNTSITLSGASGTIVPVGGYVGVIVYGGLIFKNMDARKTPISATGLNVKYTGKSYNLADNSGDEAWAAIYVNPIVGRVINGYAVNETGGNAKDSNGNPVEQFSTSEDGYYHDDDNTTRTGAVLHTLKNGKKHYTIADIDKSETSKLSFGKEEEEDGETVIKNAVPTSSANGIINVPNAQALFVLSLITQSCAGTAQTANGAYDNSLSYGTYGTTPAVYGMSHMADYDYVGKDMEDDPETTDVDESKIAPDDYSNLASGDTAANTAVPYIIRHYTDVQVKTVRNYEDKGWTISFDDNGTTKYLTLNNSNLRAETTPYYFEVVKKETSGKWKMQGKAADSNTTTKYIQCRWSNGFAENANYDQGSCIDLYDSSNNLYNGTSIDGNSYYMTNMRTSGTGANTRYYLQGDINNSANRHLKAVTNYTQARLVTFNHVVIDETNTIMTTYARCVTSTAGYYNINLTEGVDYAIPDSFRGLGAVSIYDSIGYVANTSDYKDNKFSIKLNTFDGKGCIIDQDIYLNKFYTDNYFNVLHAGTSQALSGNGNTTTYNIDTLSDEHGVGLFDSVIMKSGGKFYNFTLKGSVRTELFVNAYDDAGAFTGVPSDGSTLIWHSTAGVCGWSRNTLEVNFSNISLDNLMVSGSNYVAGLLAHSGNNSSSVNITITECSADNISLKMAASQLNGQPRNAMGAFVGKVKQGKVIVRGRATTNSDQTKTSTVKIGTFSFGNNAETFYASVGGLVGFSGHGFEAYDMVVEAKSSSGTTLGNQFATTISGGVVGTMQPFSQSSAEGYGKFQNCTVSNINVQGNYAGGIYGGKWGGNNAFVPYSITLENCQVIGNASGSRIVGGDASGGLVGNGLVYSGATGANSNITISDCIVSNYSIYANAAKHSGGFIGYCDSYSSGSSITCYIHDSSVENCVLGQGGKDKDYCGGAIGGIANKTANRMLGYNIKLDNVTSSNTNRVGAWVGKLNDTKTTIQFAGIAVYGNGFAKNIGDGSATTSFVFADYTGACNGTTVTSSAGEGETSSETWSVDSSTKTITRVIKTVSESTKTEKTVYYNYLSEPTGTNTEASDGWSIDEANGTITHISGGKEYTYTIAVSGLNQGTTVTMPKYPFVNINPQRVMDSSQIITSDGAALYSSAVSSFTGTGEQTMAAKILSEYNTPGTTRQYYNTYVNTVINSGSTINAYMNRTIEDDGDRISTYYTEKKTAVPSGVDDFPVIVIANNTTDETTDLINRYIQLVTNTTNVYSEGGAYYNVDIKTCKVEGGVFSIDSRSPALSNTSGKFSLVGANADSRRGNTFTLVDVQFYDPLSVTFDSDNNPVYTNAKIAYHLYVPVYTIKQMEVEFYSAAVNGTNSVQYDKDTGAVTSSDYAAIFNDSTKTMHFDGLNTWVTQYIRFKYSEDDISGLINTGNLRWNHDKTVIFDTAYGDTNSRLPNNTYMVLVDPNGASDKEYYLDDLSVFDTYTNDNNGWIVDFNEFSNGNTSFVVRDFADMLAPIISVDTVSGTGNYTTTGASSSNYHAYSYASDGTKVYYLFASGGDGNTQIEISGDYCEDYYISMYVPLNTTATANHSKYNNELYWYTITAGNTLEKPDKTGASAAHLEIEKEFTLFLADLFEQTTTNKLRVSPDTEQISTNNREIKVNTETEITVKNRMALMHLTNADLYHSIDLSLTRYYNDGATLKTIIGLDETAEDEDVGITAKYSIGSGVAPGTDCSSTVELNSDEGYINVPTSSTSIMNQLLANQNLATPQPLVINTEIVMTFDSKKLNDEFPLGTGNTNHGVNVGATSNLAYNNSAGSLAYTSMAVPFTPQDGHYYYRETVDTAHLYYTVANVLDQYDADGRNSENYSRLGVNGKRSDNPSGMEIITTATYNVSSISGHEDADHIRLYFSMQQKFDTKSNGVVTGVEYKDADIDKYLSGTVVFSSGSASQSVTVTPNSSTRSIAVDLPSSSCEQIDGGVYKITVTFYVITGDGFNDYANYKAMLNAELYSTAANTSQSIYPNSGIGDYIVYTNAKIITDFVKDRDEP